MCGRASKGGGVEGREVLDLTGVLESRRWEEGRREEIIEWIKGERKRVMNERRKEGRVGNEWYICTLCCCWS